MKKIKMVLSLLVLMVSSGVASAYEAVYVGPGPGVAVMAAPFPGVRLVVGRPGVYCWYQGHYYSRIAWNRYCRLHPYRYAYGYHRGYRRF